MPTPQQPASPPPGQQPTPAQLNGFARQAITMGVNGTDGRKKGPAVKRTQQLSGGGTFVPANTPSITITPSNVGLLIGFMVQVTTTINNTSGAALNLSDLGPANLLANIQLQDLQNNTRILCPGWVIALSNSVRNHGRPFGSALLHTTGIDSPTNYGNNFAGQISAPATIATGSSGTATQWYWVPACYSDDDLRGGIYINVLNSTVQLILSFPGNGGTVGQNGVTIAAANGTDSTQAVYVLAGAGTVANVVQTSVVVTVSQVFYDSIPSDPKFGLLLPPVDLATVYEVKQTTQSAIVVNQDFPYQYPNYRDILATYAVYVNNATTGARTGGTDINYWQVLTANFTAIWKKQPSFVALDTRNMIGVDLPPGFYYFNTRRKPINSTQFGNIQLIFNPSLVGAANAYEFVAIETFAVQQTLSIAGSLAAG